MACIQNFCNCSQYPPYCCSGFCLQQPGEDFGYCAIQNDNSGRQTCRNDQISTISPSEATPAITLTSTPAPAHSSASGFFNDSSWMIYVTIALVIAVIVEAGFSWLYYRMKKLEKTSLKRKTERCLTGDIHKKVDELLYKNPL